MATTEYAQGHRSLSAWVEAAGITAAVLLLRLAPMLLSRWYDPDEAAIAVQAIAMKRGATLYVDMADRKPPLPPLLYEMSFRLTNSYDIRPLRLLVALMLAAATIVLVREVRRTHGEMLARWTGGLFVMSVLAFAPIDAGAANYAHFALPFATVALVYSRRPGWRWTTLGGVMLGLAILSRQSWIFAVPAAAFSVYRAAGSDMRRRLPAVAVFAGSCTASVASCAFFVPLKEFWYWNFASSPGFVFASLGIGAVLAKGGAATGLFIARHIALVGAWAVGAKRSLRTDIDLWVWLGTGIVAISAGFRFYGHYWMQIVPPLTLLAAPVLASASKKWQQLAVAALAVVGVMSWTLLFTPSIFRDRINAQPIAAYIREHSKPTDRLFVWGTFPELLVESNRPIAGRLVHSDFVTGRSGGRDDPSKTLAKAEQKPLEMMMSDLQANPPELIVDTSGVASLGYHNYSMSVIPRLQQFVTANYAIEIDIQGFIVLRRRQE